jgi:hypothetical protein
MAGHNKGGKFERDVSRMLSLWWSGGKNDDVFWRTAGSGGRATMRGRRGKSTAQVGDIAAVDPSGEPFIAKVVLELKRGYGKFDLLDLIDSRGKKPKLVEFLVQLKEEMVLSRRPYGWLVFQRDFHKPVVVTNQHFFVRMVDYNRLATKQIPFFISSIGITGTERWGFFLLSDLLAEVSPDAFNN